MSESINNIKANRLLEEKSPYLRQHAYNPVDWYPWGDEAFETAKKRNVPVFLSIGYSSCHWCHVMENESFVDMETAEFLNKNYVSIKVDKEERPDVDHLYMSACLAYNGHGGWPLSIFLTPERHPFFAGTYFPKKDKYGMPGFLSLLKKISGLWQEDHEKLMEAGHLAIEHLNNTHKPIQGEHNPDAPRETYRQLVQNFDHRYGGFGKSPKFPSVHNLLFLLRYGVLYNDENAYDIVRLTLDSMEAGGIFDHIGGGFCRYSTDQRWLVPHFEKMMYDNAMLIMIYTEAAVLIDRRYSRTVKRIIDYCVRDMRGQHGGFYTAQDADSEGVEGKYYLWKPAKVYKILGEEQGERFCHLFDITEKGNFEGSNIPNLIGKTPTENDMRFIEQCLPKLLEARYQRIPPLKDDKVLSSSNGLMIAALSLAGRYLDNGQYIDYARTAAEFVLENLAAAGRLMARWRDSEARHLSTSDDYAYMIFGLIELYQATFETIWLENAINMTARMFELFWDNEAGGFFLSGNDVTDLPIRQKNLEDGAVPSGNSVACMNLIRLSRLTGNTYYEDKAMEIINSVSGSIDHHLLSYTGLLSAHMFLNHGGVEAVITEGEGFEEIRKSLNIYHPFSVISAVGSSYSDMERLAPFTKDYRPVNGHASAYICRKGSCTPPETETAALNEKYQNTVRQ
jgi:uncharacterized protein